MAASFTPSTSNRPGRQTTRQQLSYEQRQRAAASAVAMVEVTLDRRQ